MRLLGHIRGSAARFALCACVTIGLAAAWTGPWAAGSDPFPEIKPATRVQAITALTGGTELPVPCLTPRLNAFDALGGGTTGAPTALRRAMAVLDSNGALSNERRFVAPDGTIVRYTLDPASFDRIDGTDANGDGLPDAVRAAHAGVVDAAELLIGTLGLATPGSVEIVLADTDGVEGFALPAASVRERPRLVIRATSPGAAAVRLSAAHQFAHLVASATGEMPGEWHEALAQWTVMELAGGPTDAQIGILSARLERLAEGLLADDLLAAAGNALWFAFLDQSYGSASVALAAESLASGDPPALALERAVRGATGQSLDAALRDFHLWCLLTGERSDGRHFSFAEQLSAPPFSATADGIPDLSVQADPPVGSLGAASVVMRPGESRGGVTVLFEGAVSGSWSADLLIGRQDGSLQRVAMPVADSRAELTVPLDGVEELVLLVRNLSTDPARPLRYTWSVHRERGFPFDLGQLEAAFAESSDGILVTWETIAEHRLMGFNIVRIDEDSSERVRVNPVWVPAVGDESSSMSYQFLDSTARHDARYRYLIEGITLEGLTSRSEPVSPR